MVVSDMLKKGLSLLLRGYEYTRDLGSGSWEFAVEYDVACQAGLFEIDLRWLMARGYVESGPINALSNGQRHLRDQNSRLDTKNARFVLTEEGAAFALEIVSQPSQPLVREPLLNGNAVQSAERFKVGPAESKPGKPKPSWDRDRKELRCGEWVIKQFRWAAVNQETILMAFEEENWPARIDDPLPQKLEQDPRCRLHDTIKCLNRNHKKRLLHFSGDGTGEGVLWSFVEGDEINS